jgi:hypothetical protein
MDGILPALPRNAKRRLRRRASKCNDGGLRICYLIIINLAKVVL